MILLFMVATLVQSAPEAPAEGSAAPLLVYRDGRLSGTLEGVPLEDVLTALAVETGAEIRGAPLHPRQVHKRFDEVPLRDALERLLGRQNFTLRYDAEGTVRAIELGGAPLPPARRPPVPSRRPGVVGRNAPARR